MRLSIYYINILDVCRALGKILIWNEWNNKERYIHKSRRICNFWYTLLRSINILISEKDTFPTIPTQQGQIVYIGVPIYFIHIFHEPHQGIYSTWNSKNSPKKTSGIISNSRWQKRKERPNRLNNNGDMFNKVKRAVVCEWRSVWICKWHPS